MRYGQKVEVTNRIMWPPIGRSENPIEQAYRQMIEQLIFGDTFTEGETDEETME